MFPQTRLPLFLDEVAVRSRGPVEYHCHLLDSYGQIVWRHRFLAVSDEQAIAGARMFLEDRADSTCFFELWQDRRYITCAIDAVILELGTTTTTKLLAPDPR